MSVALQRELADIQSNLTSIRNNPMDIATPSSQADAAGTGNPGFLAAMQDVVRSVDGQEQTAAQKVEAVESGRSDDLVGAMLSSQEASLSFSMLMQVRNKVMGGLDELMKLPL
ncbi:flagellar hook-basal body complex protein FliE [Ideonella sp. B7]|nr:flagellar hook-basal body complex protein FliE [Ideonella benzenivorans]